MKRTAGKSLRTRKAMEQAIHLIFLLCGIVAVGFVLCISVYLVISAWPAIREIGLTNFLFGKVWAPTNATTGPAIRHPALHPHLCLRHGGSAAAGSAGGSDDCHLSGQSGPAPSGGGDPARRCSCWRASRRWCTVWWA